LKYEIPLRKQLSIRGGDAAVKTGGAGGTGGLDSWVWLGATEGLGAAGWMRLYPLAGQPLGFGYLFASHAHIRAGLVHATVTP